MMDTRRDEVATWALVHQGVSAASRVWSVEVLAFKQVEGKELLSPTTLRLVHGLAHQLRTHTRAVVVWVVLGVRDL